MWAIEHLKAKDMVSRFGENATQTTKELANATYEEYHDEIEEKEKENDKEKVEKIYEEFV